MVHVQTTSFCGGTHNQYQRANYFYLSVNQTSIYVEQVLLLCVRVYQYMYIAFYFFYVFLYTLYYNI